MREMLGIFFSVRHSLIAISMMVAEVVWFF